MLYYETGQRLKKEPFFIKYFVKNMTSYDKEESGIHKITSIFCSSFQYLTTESSRLTLQWYPNSAAGISANLYFRAISDLTSISDSFNSIVIPVNFDPLEKIF